MADQLELLRLADRLQAMADNYESSTSAAQVAATGAAADEIGKSFSGSWLGYHSRVYFGDFTSPPPGKHFDPEYGLSGRLVGSRASSDWRECVADEVVQRIRAMAQIESIDGAIREAKRKRTEISAIIADAISIIQLSKPDPFLTSLCEQMEKIELPSRVDIINRMHRSGKVITTDMRAINEGTSAPPHIGIKADTLFVQFTYSQASEASSLVRKAASHLERLKKADANSSRVGTNVFIGHGRSKEWRVLKDFISDRLGLPWDEFNRVPVAGISNTARLSQMLDASCIAFLVMTGEDALPEGEIRARENVVHEAGLFQGRLGFERAIVLLEEGCNEFSNIHGLGQIRFPKGNIAAAFEEIRLVLEREKIVPESA